MTAARDLTGGDIESRAVEAAGTASGQRPPARSAIMSQGHFPGLPRAGLALKWFLFFLPPRAVAPHQSWRLGAAAMHLVK
jgi:hypothetical protein